MTTNKAQCGEAAGTARLLLIGSGVWGAITACFIVLSGGALFRTVGHAKAYPWFGWPFGLLALVVIGSVAVVRSRLAHGSLGITAATFAAPVALLHAAAAAVSFGLGTTPQPIHPFDGELLKGRAFDEQVMWHHLPLLLCLLYLVGGTGARKVAARRYLGAAGTFLILPGGVAVVFSGVMVWNGFHSVEWRSRVIAWRNRGIALQLHEAVWQKGSLHVVGTLDFRRADPRDVRNRRVRAFYSYPLARGPQSVEGRSCNDARPANQGRHDRFCFVFDKLPVGLEAPGPHELHVHTLRDFVAPLPPPPILVGIEALGSVERTTESMTIQTSIAVSRQGSYRIDAALLPYEQTLKEPASDNDRLLGLVADTVEWAPNNADVFHRFRRLGAAFELGPEQGAVLRFRWRVAIPGVVARVRVWEGDGERRLLKEGIFVSDRLLPLPRSVWSRESF